MAFLNLYHNSSPAAPIECYVWWQVSEKDGLVEFADALHSRLSYFDELERIASHFHAASLAVDSTEFMPLLKRLDDCIT